MNIRQSIIITILATLPFSAVTYAGGVLVEGIIETQTGLLFPDGSSQISAASQDKYANTIFVAKSGGDFTDVQDAIDSITDATTNERYLIWIAPGNYYGGITLKPFVDLQGAGREATIIAIEGMHGGTVMNMGDHSEISSMKLSCHASGDSPTCIGIKVTDAPNGALLQDVWVNSWVASGGSSEGIRVGAGETSSNLELRNVNVSSTARSGRTVAIRNTLNTTVNIFNSTLETAGGRDVNDAIQITAGGELTTFNTVINAYRGEDISRAVYVSAGGIGTFRDSQFFVSGLKCIVITTQDEATVTLEQSRIATSNASSCNGASWGILSQGDGSGLTIDVSHSTIEAEDYTVFNPLNPSNAVYRFTHFDGGAALGNNTCLFATEETFDATMAADDCP